MPPAPTQKKSQDGADVRALRPSFAPLMRGLVLNGSLAIALLGVPWYRGRTRAEMTVQAYVEYAACLHGGTVTEVPGLALPDGHRERFAALYVGAVPEWPLSCRDALDRIPREEALFLMPGAKAGEEEVRAAAIGARSALDELAAARTSDPPVQIPRRLLRTLDHLAAAVSVHVTETSLPIHAEHLAFDLGDGPSLVSPSRIPLQTAPGGPLYVSAREGGLRAVTADARSAAVVVVHDGYVDITQIRRPPAARALLDDGTNAYLGWVTGDATCAHDEAHCAHRLTGLARIRDGVPSPEAEVWIAAHPALGLAHSFVLDGSALTVLAREADESVSARVFTLPDPWPDAATGSSAGPGPEGPMAATSTAPLGASRDIVLAGGPIAITTPHDALVGCGDRVVAIGRDASSVVTRDPLAASIPFAADVAAPAHAVDPLEDHARCATSASGASFAWIDDDAVLHLVADLAQPDASRVVASHVAGFAMTRTGETLLLATWGQDGQRTVMLRRVWHGRVLSSDVAGACWDDGSGLCGPAGLATSDAATILFTREENDLAVLRVSGSGLSALPGLE